MRLLGEDRYDLLVRIQPQTIERRSSMGSDRLWLDVFGGVTVDPRLIGKNKQGLAFIGACQQFRIIGRVGIQIEDTHPTTMLARIKVAVGALYLSCLADGENTLGGLGLGEKDLG